MSGWQCLASPDPSNPDPMKSQTAVLMNLSKALKVQGQFAEAEDSMRGVARIVTPANNWDATTVAGVKVELAGLLVPQGKIAAADRLIGEALPVFGPETGSLRYLAGLAQYERAQIRLAQGRYGEAVEAAGIATRAYDAEAKSWTVDGFHAQSIEAQAILGHGHLAEAEPAFADIIPHFNDFLATNALFTRLHGQEI